MKSVTKSVLRIFSLTVVAGFLTLLSACLSVQRGEEPPLQFPNFPGRYAEFLTPGETALQEKYQYVITRRADGYVRRQFFPETFTLTRYQEYADDLLAIRHGLHESYWDDGTPKAFGRYAHHERTGYWEFYHFAGGMKEEGAYESGQKVGPWKTFYPDHTLRAEHHFVGGELDGEQVSYDSTGQVTLVEHYDMGRLIEANEGEFAYGTGEAGEPPFEVVDRIPLFPGCPERLPYAKRKDCADRKFMKFIQSTIQYPPEARRLGVTGSAMVSFVIERDGSVTDIRVLNGLSESISRELKRLVSRMPVWIPGRQNGEAVRVQFNLPVDFRA
jgi:TonB family protein